MEIYSHDTNIVDCFLEQHSAGFNTGFLLRGEELDVKAHAHSHYEVRFLGGSGGMTKLLLWQYFWGGGGGG